MLDPRRRILLLLAVAAVVVAGTAGTAGAQGMTILTTTLPNGTRGQTYVPPVGVPLLVLGGLPPITWTVTAGAMPPGLGLTTTLGVTSVSGTPTTQGTYNFTLQAKDSLNRTGTRAYTVKINAPLSIATTSVPDGRVGATYSTTLVAAGGSAPYGWLVISGTLPGGLTLNPLTGAITGTPTTPGSFNFTVQVTDTALATATQTYSMKVTQPPSFAVTGTEIWTVNQSGFSLTVTGSGGRGSLSWGTVTGVPTGLTASRAGDVLTVAGTPTATGTWTLAVTITDEASASATLSQPLRINPPVSIADTSLPAGTAGAPWTHAMTAANGAPDYTWFLTGSPPAWMSIDGGTGALSGTPPAAGSTTVTVEVRGAAGSTASRTFDLDVNPALATSDVTFPAAVPGDAYSYPLPITGGTAPITIAVRGGQLPPGLAFSGLDLTGTPTTPGFYVAGLSVTDRWGSSAAITARSTVARRGTIGAKIPEFDLPAGATRAWVFDVVAGTKLKVEFKLDRGPSELAVQLIYADGTVIDLSAYRSDGSRKVRLEKVPLPRTGRVLLIVTNGGTAALQMRGKVKGKATKKISKTEFWGPASGLVEVAFAALPGSRVKIKVKAKGKDVPAAEFVDLTGPDGGSVSVAATFKLKSTGFRFGKTTLIDGGDHVLSFRPAVGTGSGTVRVKVKISRPDSYAFTYESSSPAPLRVDPRAATLLFRDDFEGGVSALWVDEGATLALVPEGARLETREPGGAVVVGSPRWDLAEAHVSFAGDDPVLLELRGEHRPALRIRVDRRSVTVLSSGRILAEAPIPAARDGSRLVSLLWADGTTRIAIDDPVILAIPGAPGFPVRSLAIRAGEGAPPILESAILLGRE